MLLTEHGQVYTWGGGSRGQLGHGTLASEERPRSVIMIMMLVIMIVMMVVIMIMIMMLQAGHGAGWDEDHQDSSWGLAQCGYFR